MFESHQVKEAVEFLITRGIEPISVIANWDEGTIITYANHKWAILHPKQPNEISIYELHGLKEPPKSEL